MNISTSTSTSTVTTDTDSKAVTALPAPATARNLSVANETSAAVSTDQRPLADVVAALNDIEQLGAEKRRQAEQNELVARQRFD